MQSFMITFLFCSVAMSVLALFYMIATPLLAKRYSEKGRYYAWLIIMVGLIIPFRPQWGNAFLSVEVISWRQTIAMIWLLGVVILTVRHGFKHYRFAKMARRWRKSITDERILSLLEQVKSEMGIIRRIPIFLCPLVGSPMMIGLMKPRIYLPTLELEQDELRFILEHELVHYKRKDLLCKHLVVAATVLHWFNPFVYLMAKTVNILCETSCDADVLRSADENKRLHYGETVIGVMHYHTKLKTAFSTNFYEGKQGMAKRISSIMDTRKKKAGAIIACLVLTLTMSSSVMFAATLPEPETPYDNFPLSPVERESVIWFPNVSCD